MKIKVDLLRWVSVTCSLRIANHDCEKKEKALKEIRNRAQDHIDAGTPDDVPCQWLIDKCNEALSEENKKHGIHND